MPKIAYITKKFSQASLDKIAVLNTIINEYAAQGFDLTLRQLYYQCVSRALIENNQREYKNLGTLVSDARLAGMIDWDNIVDRVRNLRKRSAWRTPAGIIDSARHSFHIDHWLTQDTYVEVWVEKNALVGVVEPVCERWDTPYFACVGYNSQSEAWEAAQRVLNKVLVGKKAVVLHLGDHDPSGRDMTRDILDRFNTFLRTDYKRRTGRSLPLGAFTVRRLALNYDQIEQYNPPPNYTKVTDSRATAYIEEFGYDCWELDALSPTVIDQLIEEAIQNYVDSDRWKEVEAEEAAGRELLAQTVEHWDYIVDKLGDQP